MATAPGDSNFSSESAARQRIVDIYRNRGLEPPPNIEAQVQRVVSEGTSYLGQIRSHAERDAASAPTPQTGTTGGDAQFTSPAAARQRIVDIYANQGLEPPPNIDAQVQRIVNEGSGYFAQIRSHAARDAQGVADAAEELDNERSLNYRGLAGNMFPWLTPGLLDLFADEWGETGEPQFALDKVRQSAEYGRVFPGIKREDGSLRMSEGDYFGEKAGFREAMSEFGINPADYESQLTDLFVNEVGARELYGALGNAYQRFVEPGSEDTSMVRSFLNSFIGSGSEVDATAAIRDSAAYDQVFTGNRREDGSLRMDEPDFFAYKRGWQRTLVSFGLNPDEFVGRGAFRESVEGELSVAEVDARLQATQDGVLDRAPEMAEWYAQNYGIDLTPEAILGMAISPALQKDVLERRILASQVGGEASLQGFSRNLERAEQLARAGVGGDQARQLYSDAAMQVPTLSALARRHSDPEGNLGIDEFENASVLGDAGVRRRIGRRMQDEQSSFSTRRNVAADQGGALTGLRQR